MSSKPRSGLSWRLLVLGLLVGGLAAWLVFASTDLSLVRGILVHDIDFGVAAAALVVYSLFFFGKALRWRYLLTPILDISAIRLIPYVVIGYAGNVLLPFQAGEAGRGYLLSRHHGIRTASSLSGIAVEKLFDFLALLILLVWALWSLDVVSPLAEQAAASIALLLMLVGGLLFALLVRPRATASVIGWFLAYCPDVLASRLKPLIQDVIDGLAALRRGKLIAKLVLSSLGTWLIMLAALHLSLVAINLQVPLAVSVVVMMLAAVGLALPTSPGFIGTLQAAFVLGMVPFGVEQAAAVAASLLYQFLTTVPPLAAGALCFFRLAKRR